MAFDKTKLSHDARRQRREEIVAAAQAGEPLASVLSRFPMHPGYVRELYRVGLPESERTRRRRHRRGPVRALSALSADMPEKAGIYVIRNIETGDSYVGATRNIQLRCRNHEMLMRRGAHTNHRLMANVAAHGLDAFVFEVLQLIADERTLERWEGIWAERLKPTLNIMPTGMAPLRKHGGAA